jgi:hypothetical protein
MPPKTVKLKCQRLSGKSLIEAYMLISFDDKLTITSNKQSALDALNSETGTNYKIPHFNAWIAGSKPIPHNIQSVMRKAVIRYLLGDEVAEMLKGIY